MFKTKRV